MAVKALRQPSGQSNALGVPPPPPVREQVATRERWLRTRLETMLLPVMRRHKAEMYPGREGASNDARAVHQLDEIAPREPRIQRPFVYHVHALSCRLAGSSR